MNQKSWKKLEGCKNNPIVTNWIDKLCKSLKLVLWATVWSLFHINRQRTKKYSSKWWPIIHLYVICNNMYTSNNKFLIMQWKVILITNNDHFWNQQNRLVIVQLFSQEGTLSFYVFLLLVRWQRIHLLREEEYACIFSYMRHGASAEKQKGRTWARNVRSVQHTCSSSAHHVAVSWIAIGQTWPCNVRSMQHRYKDSTCI